MFDGHALGWVALAAGIIISEGAAWLVRRTGWTGGIHWGGRFTDRPGWWTYRTTPHGREYRKIGRRK